jgi:hypothetical protein
MEMNNGLFLMAERVEALIRIIQIVWVFPVQGR